MLHAVPIVKKTLLLLSLCVSFSTALASNNVDTALYLHCQGTLSDQLTNPLELGSYNQVWVIKKVGAIYRWYRYNPDTKGWNRDGLVDTTGKSSTENHEMRLINHSHYMGVNIHLQFDRISQKLNIVRKTPEHPATAYPEHTIIDADCEYIAWPID